MVGHLFLVRIIGVFLGPHIGLRGIASVAIDVLGGCNVGTLVLSISGALSARRNRILASNLAR